MNHSIANRPFMSVDVQREGRSPVDGRSDNSTVDRRRRERRQPGYERITCGTAVTTETASCEGPVVAANVYSDSHQATTTAAMTSSGKEHRGKTDRRREDKKVEKDRTAPRESDRHRLSGDKAVRDSRLDHEAEKGRHKRESRIRYRRRSRTSSSTWSSATSSSLSGSGDGDASHYHDSVANGGSGGVSGPSNNSSYHKVVGSRIKKNMAAEVSTAEVKQQSVEIATVSDPAQTDHVPSEPPSRKRKRETGDEAETTTHGTPAKVAKRSDRGGGGGGSVQNAVGVVGREIKSATRKVVMEDENLLITQDRYTVVYKNASDVYKNFEREAKKTLTEAKKKLSKMVEKQLKECDYRLGRMIDKKMNRIRRVTAENGKDADTHSFVIITPKSPDLFHVTTASDRKDLDKKVNRTKTAERLVLEFNAEREFNFSQLQNILKRNKLLTKSRNVICYETGGLQDLQKYLNDAISSSQEYRITSADYTLTYAAGDVRQPKGDSSNCADDGGKTKGKKKKNVVERSLTEQHTDVSDVDNNDSRRRDRKGTRRDVSDSDALEEQSEGEEEQEEQDGKEELEYGRRGGVVHPASSDTKRRAERKHDHSPSSTEEEEAVVGDGVFYE